MRGGVWLRVKNGTDDDGAVERDPADAGQVDVPVALGEPVPEPENRREQVRAPRSDGNAGSLMTHPDREDLRNRHQQGEYGHAAQHAAQRRIRVATIGGHRRIRGHDYLHRQNARVGNDSRKAAYHSAPVASAAGEVQAPRRAAILLLHRGI